MPDMYTIFIYPLIFCFILSSMSSWCINTVVNHLNVEINTIRHLLTLLGAHHILHVNKIGVKPHLPLPDIIRSSPYSPR